MGTAVVQGQAVIRLIDVIVHKNKDFILYNLLQAFAGYTGLR